MDRFLKLTSAAQIGAFSLALAALPIPSFAQHDQKTSLVSDQSGVAFTDANLVNPWGLARSSGGPWWVSDNGTGKAILYDGTGKAAPLVVTIPPAGSPTATVFNGGIGFELAPGKSAILLFVTEDGTISGWNPEVQPTSAVVKVDEHEKSVFKGATIATVDLGSYGQRQFLYVADFRKARVQIYDSSFHHIPQYEEAFDDDNLPDGYAPLNVQNIGGDIYVTFALQDSAKHDQVNGAGLGYVDVFSTRGRLLRRFEHGPWLNAPWGLALASSDFGVFSHDLLVNQFGSGEILAFNPVTGRFKGKLLDANDQPIRTDGLWGLVFGNGTGAVRTTHSASRPAPTASNTAIENSQGNGQ